VECSYRGTDYQWNIDGEELREKQLPHLALDTLDEVIEKVCDGLKQRESDPERLRSMTYSRISGLPVRTQVGMRGGARSPTAPHSCQLLTVLATLNIRSKTEQ
jgi:hypothetical protein